MLDLHITPPDDATWEYRVVDDEVVIGRSTRAGLTISDRSLSRLHARLFHSGEAWFVEDLGSRNGTFVDQVRTDGATRISLGQTVTLGGSRLVLTGGRGPDTGRDLMDGHTVFRSADALLESGPMLSDRIDTDAVAEAVPGPAVERLRLLIDVHKAVGRSVELQELLDIILDSVFDHLKPEDGAIFLVDEAGYSRVAGRSIQGEPDSLASSSLIKEVVEGRQAALVLDARDDERFNQAHSMIMSGLRSILAAPLLDGDQALGLIVLGSTRGARAFNEDDMELLVSMASVAAMRISNIRLAEEAAERRVLEKEVALGRRIQMALLPDHLPTPAGWEIYAGNLPSRGVSGDIYKVFERDDGHTLVILVADVSGKGIAASLLTASLEALSAGPLEEGGPLDDCCRRVSRLLYDRTPPEKYSTAFIAEVDVSSGRIRYVNAGHNPGLVLRVGGEAQWLDPCGVPLGLLPTADYTVGELEMSPRDVMMLYTDGLTEASNSDGEEFEETRLKASALSNRLKPLKEMAGFIEDDLNRFTAGEPYADDRTMVLLRRSAGGAGPGSGSGGEA
ncbi:MAG: SpoIIE family protein phosphatase [Acidobacteriota bacterium]